MLYSETSIGNVQLQISLYNYHLAVLLDNNQCELSPQQLTGCGNCGQAAQLDYICTTNFGSSLGHVQCPSANFSVMCDAKGTNQSVTLALPSGYIDETCVLSCPSSNRTFDLYGMLHLDSNYQLFSSAEVADNATSTDYDVFSVLGKFIRRSIVQPAMWLWAVLSLSCCLIITIAGIIALRVGFPAWFTTVVIFTLLATSALTHAEVLHDRLAANAIGHAHHETQTRDSTPTQLDPAKVAPYATHAQACQDLGGTLAVIKSSEENTFASNYAAGVLGQSSTVTKYVFVGLTNVNGAWRWVDSTVPSYTNWQPGQPDSSGATAGTITPVVKDAAKTDWGWVVGGWDDNAQTSSQHGLCQKKAELCPSGWAYYAGTNKCFKTLTAVATYDVQMQNCQAIGGTLAIIKGAEENSFVSNYADGVLGASTTVTKYAFIGLSNADGTWKWTDSTTASYTNWQPGQPDGTGTSVGTITPVVKDVARTDWGWVVGGWDNNAASSNQYAICQRVAYGTCNDGYKVTYALAGSTFFNESELWFSGTPTDTADFVKYITNWSDAKSLGLVSIVNGKAKIAVDNKNIVPADSHGRQSVRLNTKTVFNGGLVLMDFEHMPVGSGTWPAYWMTGPNWPVTGELDIIEGGHGETRNMVTGHTSGTCVLPLEDESQMTGTWRATYPNDAYSRNCTEKGIGCCVKDDVGTFGPAVNDHQGGVVAVEWVKEKYFKLWFFKRSEIPADIPAGNPSPSCWGKPVAFLRTESNCVNRFNNLRITINTSFCGMAVPYFPGSNNAEKTAACEDYVRNNPSAFNDAYWLVNYIKVFQK